MSNKAAISSPTPLLFDPECAQTNLSAAKTGQSYHVTSLGECRFSCQQVLAAGIAPDSVIEVVRSEGSRPRLIACGLIRAAIGVELADTIRLRPCGPGCGCQNLGDTH